MNRYHLKYREVDPTYTGIGKRYLEEEHLLEKPQFERFDAAQAEADRLTKKHPDRYFYLAGNKFTCPQCGEVHVYGGKEDDPELGDLIRAKGFCWDCAFWTKAISNLADQRYIITPDFEMYFVKEYSLPNSPARPGQDRGHFGCKFEIQRLGTNEIFYTDNLWDKGSIPTAFRAEVIPNAVILRRNVGIVTPAQTPASLPILTKSNQPISKK